MNEIEKAMAILADKANCEFCEDCGNDEVCIKCKDVSPVTAEELRKFYIVAIKALREKLERDNPQPLGLEELKSIKLLEWIYIKNCGIKGIKSDWYKIVEPIAVDFSVGYPGLIWDLDFCEYGKTWLAYRHKSEHIGEAANTVEGEPEWKKQMMHNFTQKH